MREILIRKINWGETPNKDLVSLAMSMKKRIDSELILKVELQININKKLI